MMSVYLTVFQRGTETVVATAPVNTFASLEEMATWVRSYGDEDSVNWKFEYMRVSQ